MRCELGPVSKHFGGGQWLVYACNDGRSVVIVSAPENPVAPFYFMFSPSSAGYRLVGKGLGSKQVFAVAIEELNDLSAAEITTLGAEA